MTDKSDFEAYSDSPGDFSYEWDRTRKRLLIHEERFQQKLLAFNRESHIVDLLWNPNPVNTSSVRGK
jgi:hypothetical protein